MNGLKLFMIQKDEIDTKVSANDWKRIQPLFKTKNRR